MSKNLANIVYKSTAVYELRQQELSEFMEEIRNKNLRLKITGMLLYIQGSYFQLIEGPSHEIVAVYKSIKQDPRHKDIVTIADEQIETRLCHDWSMGYFRLNNEDLKFLLKKDYDSYYDLANLDNINYYQSRILFELIKKYSDKCDILHLDI